MINFNEMNQVQKIDWLSDMLGEACFLVTYVSYQEMTIEEQSQVKEVFHGFLNQNNVELTLELIEAIEKEFPTSPIASLLRQYGYTRVQPSVFAEAMEQLQTGKKVTIVKYSDFGFPIVINTVIDSVENKPYAQYKDSLFIIHKPKRKRNLVRNIILPNETLVILDGWVNVDTEKLIYGTGADSTFKQSKYSSFDKQFIKDLLTSIKQKPLVQLV